MSASIGNLRFRTGFWLMAALIGHLAISRATALVHVDPQEEVKSAAENLQSSDDEERQWATSTLCEYPEAAVSVMPELVAALNHEDPGVRECAAEALWCLGPAGREARAVLVESLGDVSPRVRAAAAFALGAMGEGDTTPLQPLCDGLQSDSVEVRVACAYAVERISGTHPPCTVDRAVIARQAVGLIDAVLADTYSPRLTLMSSVVVYLSPEIAAGAVDDLVERFRQGTENARYVLAVIGPDLGGKLFRWIDRLDDGSVTERAQAATALGLLGTSSPPVVHALARHLDDEEAVAVQAATALRRIGPSARSAVPALAKLLHSSGGVARQAAARALISVAPQRAEAEARRFRDTDPEFAVWFSKLIILSRL